MRQRLQLSQGAALLECGTGLGSVFLVSVCVDFQVCGWMNTVVGALVAAV